MAVRRRWFALIPMFRPLVSVCASLCASFRTRAALQLEILAPYRQINLLQGSQRGRAHLTSAERLFWTWLLRLWSGWRSALAIVKPKTVVVWHRQGIRLLRNTFCWSETLALFVRRGCEKAFTYCGHRFAG